jgi:hypothetical protein
MKLAVDPLSTRCKAALDNLVDDIICDHRSCLKSEFLRTNFSKGLTNLTLLTASEVPGCLFALGLLMSTDAGYEILLASKKFSKDDIESHFVEQAMSTITDRTEQAKQINKMAEDYSTNYVPPKKKMPAKKKKQRKKGTNLDLKNEDTEDSDSGTDNVKEGKGPKKFNEEHEEFEEVLRHCSIPDLLYTIETLLCFRAFYKSEEPIRCWDNTKYEELLGSIRRMLAIIKLYVPRKTGNGWKIQKFHDILHLARDYLLYGLAQNYNCGPGESGLKYWAKFASGTAQKKGPDVFLSQTVDRLHEFECFESALEESGFPKIAIPKAPEKVRAEMKEDNGHPFLKGSRVQVYSTMEKPPKWGGSERRRKGYLSLHPTIINFFDMSSRETLEDNSSSLDVKSLRIPEMTGGKIMDYYWQCCTECDIFLPDAGRRRTLRAIPITKTTVHIMIGSTLTLGVHCSPAK